MLETIQIDEFLKTGKFGEIYFGMQRDQFIEILGESDCVHLSTKKSKFPSIYKYGKVEFYFEEDINGRLYGIQVKPNNNEEQLFKLKINYQLLKPDLKFDEATKTLEDKSIKYDLINFKYDDDEGPQRIVTSGDVQLIFDDSYSIEKISKFIELNSNKPNVKQINISIPEIEYEKLRKKSLETGISIQNICIEKILNN